MIIYQIVYNLRLDTRFFAQFLPEYVFMIWLERHVTEVYIETFVVTPGRQNIMREKSGGGELRKSSWTAEC
jgi:hypothetical protein